MEEQEPKSRTYLTIEVEPSEKELFKRTAKARRLTLSALTRLLLLEETQRLGVK